MPAEAEHVHLVQRVSMLMFAKCQQSGRQILCQLIKKKIENFQSYVLKSWIY